MEVEDGDGDRDRSDDVRNKGLSSLEGGRFEEVGSWKRRDQSSKRSERIKIARGRPEKIIKVDD